MFRSPRSGRISLSRVLGALTVCSACYIGIYGVMTGVEHAGVVTALAIGAGVALLSRDRAPKDRSDDA